MGTPTRTTGSGGEADVRRVHRANAPFTAGRGSASSCGAPQHGDSLLFNPSTALSPELNAQLTELREQTITRIAGMVRHLGTFDDERSLAFAYAISGVGEQLGRWWLTRPDIPRSTVVAYYRDFITPGLDLR
ncbi:hypothetical protein [Pseudonocardia sp. ICBG1142]|uniref:hypothetical protein n=1 Tax=Pseudonocardia sp. ICBG1142 TaxID=2846760 RepID=UPI001CF69B16|nr:hypothetical protein [Pseudonocardia sp. ICBG1142]